VKIWDIRSEKLALTFSGHRKEVKCVLFSLDGTAVFSGSNDHTIQKFETKTGRVLWTAVGHSNVVRCLSISADLLASGSFDHSVRIWSSESGKCRFECNGHTDHVMSVDFCPTNDRILCSASDDLSIRLWNTRDGSCLFVKERAHDDDNLLARFTFDGQRLISGSFDDTLKVWRVDGTGAAAAAAEAVTGSAPKKTEERGRTSEETAKEAEKTPEIAAEAQPPMLSETEVLK